MNPATLEFKMMGPIFDDGLPLHLVTDGLNELQSILDKPYLYLEKKQRIVRNDRNAFYTRATSLRQGCFIADLEIIYQSTQMVLPGVMAAGPETIWNYTKETWAFLKLIYERAQKGEQAMYQTNDQGVTNVIYGNNNYVFNAPVTLLAPSSMPHYKKMASLLNVEGVEQVHLGDTDSPEVVLDKSSAGLFRLETHIDPEVLTIQCELFDFNKHKHGGKLTIACGEAIPPGEYPFSIIGTQAQSEYIVSMLHPIITVKCHREVQLDPLGETKIIKLHILGISEN